MATQVPARRSKFQSWESNIEQTRGAGAYAEAFSAQSKPLKAGKYKISVGCEIGMDTPGANTKVLARFKINGNEKRTWVNTDEEYDGKD